MLLQPGTKAPDFLLPDQNGQERRLSDYLGKWVVLYFYPKDGTAGCTTQALGFAQQWQAIQDHQAVILGVSKDSVASHLKFAQRNELPFVLLSDPEFQVLQTYGVWQEKRLYGRVSMGTVRTTYLIDPQGVIRRVFEKVKASESAQQVLQALEEEA